MPKEKRLTIILAALFAVATAALFLCSPLPRMFAAIRSQRSPETRLVYAAQDGDLAKVKDLLARGVSVNARAHYVFGWTPLIAAVQRRQTNVVEFLLMRGADPNVRDAYGKTALMWAIARRDDSTFFVTKLIKKGANVNARTDDGATALRIAIGSSCTNIEAVLRNAGAQD